MSFLTRISMILVTLILSLGTAIAQNRSISGTVVDAAGQPVIGASVIVSGNSTVGTVTGVKGEFTLSVPAGAKIEVASLGYQTQVLDTANQTQFNVVLVEDNEFLDEVVVVGYGTQKKSDLTGAVASVRGEDLMNRSTSDAAAALQGKAAGVQIVNTSGAPGTGSQIRVRGISSNSGNIGPLMIVDGLKVDSIQYLDPSMIESMEVLKDGASAAIYGAEAGNGVVLITTKQGKSGHASISYEGKFMIQSLAKKAELFDADEYIEFQKAINPSFDDKLLSDNKWDGKNHNWFDAVFAPSFAHQHALTFQGGNDKGHFFAQLNYVDNDGIIVGKNDTYRRLSAQLNADYNIFKWFQVGTNTSIEKWDRKNVSESSYGSMLNSVMSLDPLTPAYVHDIKDAPTDLQAKYSTNPELVLRDPNHNNDFYNTSRFLQEATGNPLIQRDRTEATSGGVNVRGTLYANLKPVDGLVITSRFGYRITQSSSHSYSAPYYLSSMANNTQYNISANVNTGLYYQWENFANYNKVFADKHDFTAMIGMSYIANNWDNVNTSAQGTDIMKSTEPNFRYMDFVKGDVAKTVGNAPGKSTSISYYARLGYTYDKRYSIQANFRADAFDSSKLAKKSRWGYFPSASIGWTISNESFVKDNVSRDALSFLKIRASWGRNGNVNILNNYPYSATIALNDQWYQYNPSDPNGPLTYGSGPTTIANEDLKWETSNQIDVGLDARFLRDRLTFGFDWYRKTTDDLLSEIKVVPEVGVKSSVVNAGTVLNTGVELEISWKDHVGDFHYSIAANVTTIKNKVTSMHATIPRLEGTVGGVSGLNNKIRTAFEVGQPTWYFRGYKYAGVGADGAPLYYNAAGEKTASVTENDLQYIGKSIPDALYGITVNLSWKGLDFSVFGSGQAGNQIFSLLYSADRERTNSLNTFWRNSYKAGNTNAKYPDMSKVGKDWTFWSSSAALFNGSYFKFKQIQLGYTLPQDITKKALISNLRFYVSLDDFFTITTYPGCDPETATTGNFQDSGYDAGTYPTIKKVLFGINLTF